MHVYVGLRGEREGCCWFAGSCFESRRSSVLTTGGENRGTFVRLIPWSLTNSLRRSNRSVAAMSHDRRSLISVNSHGLISAPGGEGVRLVGRGGLWEELDLELGSELRVRVRGRGGAGGRGKGGGEV